MAIRRGDVKTRFALGLGADLALAFDDDNAVQARPVVPLLKPLDVMDHRGSAGLDTAVITIDGLVLADGGVFEISGLYTLTKSSTSWRSVP